MKTKEEYEKELEELKELSLPILKFLEKYHDPHTTVTINSSELKIVQDVICYPMESELDILKNKVAIKLS
jgi:hypothetical protein